MPGAVYLQWAAVLRTKESLVRCCPPSWRQHCKRQGGTAASASRKHPAAPCPPQRRPKPRYVPARTLQISPPQARRELSYRRCLTGTRSATGTTAIVSIHHLPPSLWCRQWLACWHQRCSEAAQSQQHRRSNLRGAERGGRDKPAGRRPPRRRGQEHAVAQGQRAGHLQRVDGTPQQRRRDAGSGQRGSAAHLHRLCLTACWKVWVRIKG